MVTEPVPDPSLPFLDDQLFQVRCVDAREGPLGICFAITKAPGELLEPASNFKCPVMPSPKYYDVANLRSGQNRMKDAKVEKRSPLRHWIRRAFLAWAIVSTLWLFNAFRTQGVDHALLASDAHVSVQRSHELLAFLPALAASPSGVVRKKTLAAKQGSFCHLYQPVELRKSIGVIHPFRLRPLRKTSLPT